MRTTDDVAHARGTTYEEALDGSRLTSQLAVIRAYMFLWSERGWRTLREIGTDTGYPEASISARLRDLRRPVYGALTVDRRRRGDGRSGIHEYRVQLPRPAEETASCR